MNKKYGFTLAEVLITLGIIGVVAAMTIPTLIANTNSARFRSQFKKSISTLSQAGLMAQAQYDIDYSTATEQLDENDQIKRCTSTDNPEEVYTFCAIFNGALAGHTLTNENPKLKDGEDYTPFYNISNRMYLTLADGSLVVFNSGAHDCHREPTGTIADIDASCFGYIDVNGVTLPNKPIACDENSSTNSSGNGAGTGAGSGGGGASANAIENAYDGEDTCVVPNDANHLRDIFPIVFHDGMVEPLSRAARYVLTTAK